MRIPINKEIEKEYKDQFLRGFSMRECGFIALAVAIIGAVAFAAGHFFSLPLNLCFYIGIPFGIPPLVVGFAEFQGLTLMEYIKEIIYEHKTKELYYDANEMPTNSKVYKMTKHESKKAGRKK